MSRFQRRRHRDVPGLNLAAMPDLIFTVLFFFMIVTHMRQVQPLVRYEVPQGTEVEKAQRKGATVYLFIGHPLATDGSQSEETRIQLGDRYVTIDEIGPAIERERKRMSSEDRQHLVVSIRADRNVEMGIINDVKQALRRAGALNINYSATGKQETRSER